jgi:iron complex outermembrane receptor protein
MIPLSAVERIEVLTDGSSAVYGSDAVGGVVNIILRKDFNGAESGIRLDTLTQGGGEQKQAGQTFGRTWDGGGALAVLQFQDSNVIRAQDRTATDNLAEPTDVYPSAKRYSGVFTGHQALHDSLEVYADALLQHDDGFRAYTSGGPFSSMQLLSNKTNFTSADTGLRWQPFGDWRVEANTLFSQLDTLIRGQYSPPMSGYTNGAPYLRNLFTIDEADLKLDGTLWSSGGSSVKAAAGASYRREDFSSLVPFQNDNRTTSRRVSAGFAELYAPLVTSANAFAMMQKLELSAAVRHDAYSDFGAKTNPRFGLYWSPITELGVRAAYSTSFRAPNPIENISALSANAVYAYSGFPLANGNTGNVIFFGNQVLNPETSRNLTIGLDFAPSALPNTRLSLNYYRIDYSDRLIESPTSFTVFQNPQVYGPLIKTFGSDAAVDAFVAGLEPPQMVVDYTSGGTGLAGVRYGFPYGEINATKEITEGFDLGAHTLLTLSGNNKLLFDLNTTYIKEITTTFCNTCTSIDLVNTYGEPLKFRARGAAGWSNGPISTNAAINFQNAYSDTNVTPSGHISSWTTADVNVGYRFLTSSPITVGLNVINLFDANPPRTAPGLSAITYDPTNADIRGRIVSLQARVQW